MRGSERVRCPPRLVGPLDRNWAWPGDEVGGDEVGGAEIPMMSPGMGPCAAGATCDYPRYAVQHGKTESKVLRLEGLRGAKETQGHEAGGRDRASIAHLVLVVYGREGAGDRGRGGGGWSCKTSWGTGACGIEVEGGILDIGRTDG